MISGPRVTCKVSSTSPSQWNPRCMSSWLIISTLRLWLRPSGGWFEDNVSIKTATLPRICICHCLRVARSPKMWAAILFGKDFPPILNTRESPFLTRIFSATLPVVFGASTTRTREEAIDYVTWTRGNAGFSFTTPGYRRPIRNVCKMFVKQKSMIICNILRLEHVSLNQWIVGSLILSYTDFIILNNNMFVDWCFVGWLVKKVAGTNSAKLQDLLLPSIDCQSCLLWPTSCAAWNTRFWEAKGPAG